jgi:phage-related protein
LFPFRETFNFIAYYMKARFEVEFLEEAIEFLSGLNEKDRDKIIYNIDKSRFINDPELLKKLNSEIWEFRTIYNGKSYRLFAFGINSQHFNKSIIITHGFIKKSNKTPKKELEKAESIKRYFFNSKK